MDLNEIADSSKNVFLNKFKLNVTDIKEGIIFFYCTWAHVDTQFLHLLSVQRKYPSINLYLFDIELDKPFLEFRIKTKLRSHGWGETYWIRDGKITNQILKYHSPKDLQAAESYTNAMLN